MEVYEQDLLFYVKFECDARCSSVSKDKHDYYLDNTAKSGPSLPSEYAVADDTDYVTSLREGVEPRLPSPGPFRLLPPFLHEMAPKRANAAMLTERGRVFAGLTERELTW